MTPQGALRTPGQGNGQMSQAALFVENAVDKLLCGRGEGVR